MKEGFCIIGLERSSSGFRSLRPIPAGSFAWREFPYKRSDRVEFDLQPLQVFKPHVEDRMFRNHRKLGSISEEDMLACLKQSEVAASVTDLFGCTVRSTQRGANYVQPSEGNRSICGCTIGNISFSFKYYPPKIRATLYLESGDRLDGLPVVDHDWVGFAENLWAQKQGQANLRQRLQRFFNRQIQEHILSSDAPFVRVGVTRPFQDRCWLMLDSIFPLPKDSWLEEFE